MPNGPINSIRDMMEDEHFIERGMFESVEIEESGGESGGESGESGSEVEWRRRRGSRMLKIPAMVPKLVDTPGRTNFAGPTLLGGSNVDVFETLLKMTKEERELLEADGII